MITHLKPATIIIMLIACITLGFFCFSAQGENTSETKTDPNPTDKWAQIQDNNKKMSKSLEEIEQNLDFVKARSMAGGRK